MNNVTDLDFENWGSYFLKDIFNFKRGKRITKEFAECDENKGNIPVIGGGEGEHGIFCYVNDSLKNDYVFQEKCFTCSAFGSVGSVLYHNYSCFIDDKCLSFTAKQDLSLHICLFIEVVLNQEKYRYSYGKGITEERYKETIIKLPSIKKDENSEILDITKEFEPDFSFMENYVKNIYETEEQKIKTNIKRKELNLEFDKWENFKLKDIFKISKCKPYNKTFFEKGSIPYITRTKYDNGVIDFVETENETLNNGKCIVVGGESAIFFYQEHKFIAGTNITKLYNNNLNRYNALFLITIFNQENFKYNYGRALNKEMVKQTIVKLPIDSNKNIDWQFMENYIKQLPYSDCI